MKNLRKIVFLLGLVSIGNTYGNIPSESSLEVKECYADLLYKYSRHSLLKFTRLSLQEFHERFVPNHLQKQESQSLNTNYHFFYKDTKLKPIFDYILDLNKNGFSSAVSNFHVELAFYILNMNTANNFPEGPILKQFYAISEKHFKSEDLTWSDYIKEIISKNAVKMDYCHSPLAWKNRSQQETNQNENLEWLNSNNKEYDHQCSPSITVADESDGKVERDLPLTYSCTDVYKNKACIYLDEENNLAGIMGNIYGRPWTSKNLSTKELLSSPNSLDIHLVKKDFLNSSGVYAKDKMKLKLEKETGLASLKSSFSSIEWNARISSDEEEVLLNCESHSNF